MNGKLYPNGVAHDGPMERRDSAGRTFRLAVNTQTPLVRLRQDSLLTLDHVHLDDLAPEQDYKLTAGGVTRMLLPMLRRGLTTGRLAAAEWVALGGGPNHPSIRMPEGFTLRFVGVDPGTRRGYARAKEHAWALLNSMRPPEDTLPDSAWTAFLQYQRLSARELERSVVRMGGADTLYVHDFQQMGVAGEWAGARIPRVFHLHTPFPDTMPAEWKSRIVDSLDRYDAVVCSTRRYATNLVNAGLKTPLHIIPPFIDPSEYHEPSQEAVAAFRRAFGLSAEEPMVLHVGRMDPMKGQDRLVRMMPRLLEEVPNARLVLVGNGSFSSSKNGGLGLSKGQKWRQSLEALCDELGVRERVTFTGHLDDDGIQAALTACDAFVLPSTREGFGLAAVEAWRYRKPVVVSKAAGVADIFEDRVNGVIADCADPQRLAREVADILATPQLAQRLGEQGFEASHVATLPEGEARLHRLFADLQEDLPRAHA